MSERFSIAGTGHRPNVIFEKEKYPYAKEHQDILVKFAQQQILNLMKSANKTIAGIISGMATGWDQGIARAAINLGLPLLAAVPFEGMESKWPESGQKEYKDILSKAAKVHIVCEGGYEAKKFYLRDKYMVDNADIILALYNGAEKGGTAITVKYAEEVKKPITNCWNDWETHWNGNRSSV